LPLVVALTAYNGSTLMTLITTVAIESANGATLSPGAPRGSTGEAMPTAKQLDEVITLFVARFPNTFVMFQERPKKLGIHHDLAAALGEVEHLGAALAYYHATSAYLKAQKIGAKQVDLEATKPAASTRSRR
jgi:ProP effector